ncbi:response regulator transcription factor [Amycolatopsis echigonensis]
MSEPVTETAQRPSDVPDRSESPVPGSIQVAVIEDHPLYRRSVERVLLEAPDVELGAVVDSVARFHVARQPAGSVVLLDLGLPGVAGAAAVLEVAELGHHVLVVSAQAEPETVLAAIAAGAKGFLSKDVDVDELLIAIRAVAGGGAYVSAVVAGMIIKDNTDRPVTRPEMELSPREAQVLRLVAAGERDVDIARILGIGVRTVRGYLDRIRDKTGERRRPGLVKEAIRRGLVGKETVT